MAPQMLLVFCDGTGMDGNLASRSSVAQSTKGNVNEVVENSETTSSEAPRGGGNKQFPTNVIRLARSVKPLTAKGKKQIVFYQSGVGSEANFKGDQVTGTTFEQALGTAVASKIRDAYAFIAQNYEDKDEICIFGRVLTQLLYGFGLTDVDLSFDSFSRGAYTARKVSGLIDRIGLLKREHLGQFFLIWSQLVDGETPTIPTGTRRPRIKCVGVWDTVGSVYKTIDALAIKDTSLPATIDLALHGISLQENRKSFLPTLWTAPPGGVPPTQKLKQIWFPGAHSDVGGGYERRELQDLSLFWMAGEIESFVDLDLDFLQSTRQQNPEPWGTSQPHNAYSESSLAMQAIVGHETRLQSKQINKDSDFHKSLEKSPQKLTSPQYMITNTIIKNELGAGFQPKYVALNAFETKCKNNWKSQPKDTPEPIFDDPGVIIRPPVYWTPGTRGILPPSAIEGGRDSNGDLLYIARAPYAGGLRKASSEFVYISYDGKEIIVNGEFELLVGDRESVRWLLVDGRLSHQKLGDTIAVLGGHGADGDPFFIAQAATDEGIQCGKVKFNGHATIPLDGSEFIAESYNVLIFS
ncbi:hypothetical protein DEU56DRAFT_931058 [Suillus clintonianus]|uniref:uncharacterized protein n=1 Tax=Suillus clintonianus TaxID=1904413 RepID=UPI001B879DE9|nr:uncharacterized protein DEU56DRAFT_931058 [Suillus clintonianus]KAG2146796.1 hypothetical protein DEU56DRAFT_931058 [Suillus clintonianus]